MDELEELKRKKIQEMQQRYQSDINAQVQEEANFQQQLKALENIVKQAMTKEALQRYGNIKTVDPEKAVQLLAILGQFASSGKLKIIDDNLLKEILKKITPKKKEFKITRK